ncbi:MAG: MFS transporter [Burkholderiales bacterium]
MTSTVSSKNFPPLSLAWTVWGLGAMLYVIAFYQRVAPAVLTRELMADFSLSAAALGNLSAFYFYSYVAIQIPTGIMADKFGPRRLLTAGAAITAIGTLVFALAPTVAVANFGRLLIGASAGVAFVGMMKIASHWLPAKLFALASGMALATGIAGAVFAGVPLREMATAFGWRNVMIFSAGFSALLAAATWWLVRDDPAEKNFTSYFAHAHEGARQQISVISGLKRVLSYRNTWLLFAIPGGAAGPIITFAGLWGVPYLVTHRDLTTNQAAMLASAMMISWAIGGPVLGTLSQKLGRRKPFYILSCFMLAVGWSTVIFFPLLPFVFLIPLLLVIGFFSGMMIIGFAFAKESVPLQFGGTVSGVTNMGVMMGPMILQPLVGWMLDKNWHGTLKDGARVYDLAAYQSGFKLMLAWTLLSMLLILLTKETYCKQTVQAAD